MSREQLFEAIEYWVAGFAVGLVAVIALQAAAEEDALPRSYLAPLTDPQARSDPAPIFRCSDAGGGVVVSLGGDGSSLFAYCEEVKS